MVKDKLSMAKEMRERLLRMALNRELRGDADYEIYITHALLSPWKQILEHGQLQTWAKPSDPRVRHTFGQPVHPVLHFFDDYYWKLKWSKFPGKLILVFEVLTSKFVRKYNPRITIVNNRYTEKDVLINLPDLYMLQNIKSLAIHKYAAKSERDFVLLTTTSSYINSRLLKEKLAELPRMRLVAGRIVTSGKEKFLSGSFRIYSPDVLREVMVNLKDYKSWLAEDLAIGNLVKNHGFPLVELKSLDISSMDELESLTRKQLEETIHYRVKSGTLKNRNDIQIMNALHSKLSELGAA